MPHAWLLHAVDAALLLSAAELIWWLLRSGQGLPSALRPSHLIAGMALMMALRLALSGAPAWAIAASLGAAGLAHALDIRATRSAQRTSGSRRVASAWPSPRWIHHALPSTPPSPPSPPRAVANTPAAEYSARHPHQEPRP